MKLLHVFPVFMLCSLACYGIGPNRIMQLNEDSLIHTKGYYVRMFEKKKIIDIEKNRQNRLQRKSFRVYIDTDLYQDFFLPIGMDSMDLEKMLYGLPGKNKKAIYLYCTNANYSIFNAQFRTATEEANRDTCFRFSSTKYYTLSKQDKYCYQVFYLSGNWLKGVAKTQMQKNIFFRQMKYIEDTSSPVSVFLLNKICVMNEMQNLPLKLWKEVPCVFDNQ